MKLNGKTVLITGASSGIGKAFALRCAYDDCTIILAARDVQKLEEVKKLVEERSATAIVMPTDVTNPEEVKNLFLAATEEGRVLDIVFDNAGLGFIAKIWEQPVEEIGKMIDVNTKGMLYVAKYATEVMVRQKHGHLIMTSSIAGLLTVPEWATYVASKWAITGFADSIRMELKPYNVKVTTLHPGLVKTDFFGKGKAQMTQEELDKQDAITPEEVAEALYDVLFTNRQKLLIPDMVKNYVFLQKYLPGLANKVIESQLKGEEDKKVKEDEPEFSYIKSVKE